MEKKGLCATCVQSVTCIFLKEPPVWQCEEFSNGNHVSARGRQEKVKQVVYEQVTESE